MSKTKLTLSNLTDSRFEGLSSNITNSMQSYLELVNNCPEIVVEQHPEGRGGTMTVNEIELCSINPLCNIGEYSFSFGTLVHHTQEILKQFSPAGFNKFLELYNKPEQVDMSPDEEAAARRDIKKQAEDFEASQRKAALDAAKVAKEAEEVEKAIAAVAAAEVAEAAAVKNVSREGKFAELKLGHPKKQVGAHKTLKDKVVEPVLKAYQALLDKCGWLLKLTFIEGADETKIEVNGHNITAPNPKKDVWGDSIDASWWDIVRFTLPRLEGNDENVIKLCDNSICARMRKVIDPAYNKVLLQLEASLAGEVDAASDAHAYP